ncbi:MAG: ArnT family glycosyltransferase, partial [Candidatus Odinarchaeota archaeon]
INGGQASLEQIMAPDRPFSQLAQRQMMVVIVNVLIVVGIYLLARRIFGTKAALMGATLIALNPFFLAESRVLRFEALVAGFMPLSLLAVLLYLKTQLSPAKAGLSASKFLLLSAVLTALAMLTKISAVFLIPVVALLGAVTVFGASTSFTRPIIIGWLLKYLIWAGLVIFCFWLFWPAMWVAPMETLQEVRHFVESAGDEGFAGRGVFFWGEVYPDSPGYWFYPVALLFRITPLTLIGVIIAVVMLASTFKCRWPVRDEAGWQWLGTVWLLVYALLFVVMMTLGAKKYDRYLMPIFPALDLVAGVGWLWLGQWLFLRCFQLKRPRLALGVGYVCLLGLQSLTTLPHLPYYYTFYNPLLGGIRQAVDYVPVGYAEGLDRAAAYLEQKPNASKLKVASGNSSKLEGLFSGQTIALANLDGKWVQADYVLIYISQLQRGKHAEDILAYLARYEPEYTLVLHGLEYAWLYPGPAVEYYGGGHKLEGRGTLFGYELSKTELAAGESLPITLYWRNEGQRETDRFFVRLMDLDGYAWAEAIAQPRPGFEQANRNENSIVESEASLTLPEGMPPGDYFFKPGFRTDSGEIIGYFELPGDTKPIKVTTANDYPPLETFEPPYPAHLLANDEVILLGYDFYANPTSPEPGVWLTLYWQALADVTRDYVILLRLLDNDQQEVAYWLGRPVRSGYPTTEWKARQIVQDPWLLTLPTEVEPGPYQLEVAVFDAGSEIEVARQIVGRIGDGW